MDPKETKMTRTFPRAEVTDVLIFSQKDSRSSSLDVKNLSKMMRNFHKYLLTAVISRACANIGGLAHCTLGAVHKSTHIPTPQVAGNKNAEMCKELQREALG